MRNRVVRWMLMLWAFNSCESPMVDETDRILSDTLQVATYNVRVSTPVDQDHRSWAFRRNYVALQIYRHDIDLVAFQEIADLNQENDLRRLLSGYRFFVRRRGNNDGTEGQGLAIAWETRRFACLDSGFFFLSEVPNACSLGWESNLPHVCQWVRLRDQLNHHTLFFYNTHLSCESKEARLEGMRQICDSIEGCSTDVPLLLGGDFNAPPSETEFYATVAHLLSDSRSVTETPPAGSEGTFNNWEVTPWLLTGERRLDYLFVRGMRVLSYEVPDEPYVDDCWPSDHFPVMISVVW